MTTATVKHHRMLIGGEDIDSPQRMTVIDPGDESVVATVARGDTSHIDAAVIAAKNAFDAGTWSRSTPHERAAVMRRIAAAANDAAEELVEL
jgi:aldehyde dehydrogenase (NAD+)